MALVGTSGRGTFDAARATDASSSPRKVPGESNRAEGAVQIRCSRLAAVVPAMSRRATTGSVPNVGPRGAWEPSARPRSAKVRAIVLCTACGPPSLVSVLLRLACSIGEPRMCLAVGRGLTISRSRRHFASLGQDLVGHGTRSSVQWVACPRGSRGARRGPRSRLAGGLQPGGKRRRLPLVDCGAAFDPLERLLQQARRRRQRVLGEESADLLGLGAIAEPA